MLLAGFDQLWRPVEAAHANVYFFMHIAKAGGQAFADDLGKNTQLGPSAGYVSCGALHIMHVGNRSFVNCTKYLYEKKRGCNLYACEGNLLDNLRLIRGRLAPTANVRTLVLVREPEALILSEYAHCQQDGAGGQRNHRYPQIELSAWVQLWAQGHANTARKYCGYHANNPQTYALSSYKSTPDVVDPALGGGRAWQPAALKQARQVVDEAHVVGVTGAYSRLSVPRASARAHAALMARAR